MLVAVTGFGSVWRNRLGRTEGQTNHFLQTVYYNTTGVVVNGRARQRSKICGYARFDEVGGFDPNRPSSMIDRIFECGEPSLWMGCNKLQFRRLLSASHRPDRYLALVRSDRSGRLLVGHEGWRSPRTWLISFSESGEQQEAMFLLSLNDWITTELGKFLFVVSEQSPWRGRLILCAQN